MTATLAGRCIAGGPMVPFGMRSRVGSVNLSRSAGLPFVLHLGEAA